jgi:S1-C subfamily serine protease
MRMAFGLVGILVTLGVIIWFMHVYELPAAKQGIQTKKKIEAWAESNTSEGMADAKASIVLEEVDSGGKFTGFLVKSIVPGGPMARDFGLAAGDTIVAIGGMRMRDTNDAELSEAQLFGEAKLYNRPLTVIRGNQEIELQPQNALR